MQSVAGLILAALFVALTLMRPHVGIGVWLVVTIFVPSWTVLGVAGFSVTPAYLVLPVLFGFLLRTLVAPPRASSLRLHLADITFGIGVVFVMWFHYFDGQARYLQTNVLFALAGAYIVGRLAGVSAQKVYAIAMVVVALWGIAEFVFSWHAFTTWQTTEGIGPALQQRGGYTRSEATLGHAIAYGASLAAALPFTRMFRRPIVLQLILAIGVIVSFSRGPMLAVLLTIALMVYIERSVRHRAAFIGMLAAGMVVAYFVFTFLYSGAGAAEVQSSSQQRDQQLARALDYVNIFGPANDTQLNSTGQYVTNGVTIIDSVWLRLTLDFGWIVCLLLLSPIAAAVVRVAARRVGPASIAVAGQLPVLLATSFITQWQTLFYFLCGMAVSEWVTRRNAATSSAATDTDLSDEHEPAAWLEPAVVK